MKAYGIIIFISNIQQDIITILTPFFTLIQPYYASNVSKLAHACTVSWDGK